jgi:hypothetical protein
MLSLALLLIAGSTALFDFDEDALESDDGGYPVCFLLHPSTTLTPFNPDNEEAGNEEGVDKEEPEAHQDVDSVAFPYGTSLPLAIPHFLQPVPPKKQKVGGEKKKYMQAGLTFAATDC